MNHSHAQQTSSGAGDYIMQNGRHDPLIDHRTGRQHVNLSTNSATVDNFMGSPSPSSSISGNNSRTRDGSIGGGVMRHGGGGGMMRRDNSEMAQDVSDEGVQETLSEEVFAKYHSTDLIPGARIHPGNIVEAASLSAIPLPKPTYDLAASIPRELITEGKLSRLQLEGILYACQRHLTILPNGTRAGCFVGDAAAVGKGRQIAGVILDNYCRGRTKHIWFSISADLKVDAQRDVNDIGCHIKVIEGCQQIDKETKVLGLPKDLQHGVIFSTYSTLVSSTQRGGMWGSTRKSRLDQLISWCGGETFDGCLIFDECHKAKHFIPGKEDRSTKVAVAVATIQRMLPKARVLYCSATGVSDVKNMAFMERLGMWGEGAAFKSFDHFLEAINRRGLGVAEMVAMEMKASGMYVSRVLSFKEAEFVTMEMDLTAEQITMYDTAAHVWNEFKVSLEAALGRTNTGSPRLWSYFWSCHQRFFKQLCLGVKVPKIIEEAKKALDDGFCIVIGLQTTGEASMDSELNKEDSSQSGFVSVAREILVRFINQYFPTRIISNEMAPGVSLSSISADKPDSNFSAVNSVLQDSISVMGLKEPYVLGCKVIDKDSRDVGKFLNRILGIRVEKQNLIFNYFYECLQAAIAMAKKEGKYTEGLVDIHASSVEMVCPPKTVFKEANTSTPTQLLSLSVDRGLNWEAAVERSERFTGKHDGFYCSKREQFGKTLFIVATQKENSTHLFKIARPNTGVSYNDEEFSDFQMRYKPISKEEAEEGWKEQYEATKQRCIHGSHCKNPGSCTIGTRLHGMDLLCGGIVTLLSTLETTISKHASKLDLR